MDTNRTRENFPALTPGVTVSCITLPEVLDGETIDCRSEVRGVVWAVDDKGFMLIGGQTRRFSPDHTETPLAFEDCPFTWDMFDTIEIVEGENPKPFPRPGRLELLLPGELTGEEASVVAHAAHHALFLIVRAKRGKATMEGLMDRVEDHIRAAFAQVTSSRFPGIGNEEYFRLTLERGDLGGLLHTALRKACHSHPTSAAWNHIALMNEDNSGLEHWKAYLDVVWAALQREEPSTRHDVADVVREASLQEFEYIGRPWRAGLYVIFEMFSPFDWLNYTSYLSPFAHTAVPLETRERLMATVKRRRRWGNGDEDRWQRYRR